MDYFDWGDYASDPTTVYNPIDPGGPGGGAPAGPSFDYGMGDRGLGTVDPLQSDNTGVLSPQAIAALGSGTQIGANGLPVPNPRGLGGPQGQRSLFTNADGSMNWPAILSILGPLAGGAYAANRTGAANQQIQQSIQKANDQITGILGGNAALFQPYRDAGVIGLNRLTSMPQSNLAARYKPLGTGAGFSLGTIAKGS